MNYTESFYLYCHHAPKKNLDKWRTVTVSWAGRQIYELRINARHNARKEMRCGTVV